MTRVIGVIQLSQIILYFWKLELSPSHSQIYSSQVIFNFLQIDNVHGKLQLKFENYSSHSNYGNQVKTTYKMNTKNL